MTKIIDVHTHLMPPDPAQPDPASAMLQDAAGQGIGTLVTSCIHYEEMGKDPYYPLPAGVHRANQYAAETSRKHTGRLYFMGYINPQNPDWKEEMNFCISQGACGIKLWVSLKDHFGKPDNTIRVLQYAAQKNMPVYIHVFNRTGGNLPGEVTMDEFAGLSRAVPDCRLIAGHTGGNWRRSAQAAKQCSSNVWLEIGGSNPDHGMVNGILKFCPPERLLYGSDAPGRTFFPQLWKVLESSLSEADRERVFLRNAMELLHLPEPLSLDEPVHPEIEKNITDYCCFCGHYPYEKRPEISPEQLEHILTGEGIPSAYTADLEAVFAPDPESENDRFLAQCRNLTRIKPLAVVNPAPDWKKMLEKVSENPAWSGLWLSPPLHQWHLNDPAYTQFLQECARSGKPVFLNFGVYEPRFYHPEMKFILISDDELKTFLQQNPFREYIIQNRIPPAGTEFDSRCFWCNTKLTDHGNLLKNIQTGDNPPQIVHGSEFPFRHIREVLEAAGMNF